MRKPRCSLLPSASIDLSGRVTTAVAIALFAGCGDPTAAPPSALNSPTVAPSGEIALYAVAPVPSEFSWSQGQSAKLLGSAADRVCYLTYVAGDFDGSTEWVGITISLGKWWLTGGSARSGVNAKARCIPVSSYGAEVSLAQFHSHDQKYLNGYSCGFTRLGGRFNSSQDQVRILPDGSPAQWPRILYVSSWGGYVEGRVRCITSPVQITSPVGWFGSGTLVTLASTASPWTCFLTGMRGPFEGSGDWIFAFKGTSVWYLWGDPHPDRYAAGSCVK